MTQIDEVREAIKSGMQKQRGGHALKHTDEEMTDAILTAIAAKGYVIEQGWQPIETAPKDGTHILVWFFEAEIAIVVSWSEDGGGGWPWRVVGGDDRWNGRLATHWRPLPDPLARGEG